MEKVFSITKALSDKKFHYCPGCTHGIIHRILAEVLEELDVVERTVGITPVGCAGFCEEYFVCDMIGAAHGRAVAVGTGAKKALQNHIVFTYQGDGDGAAIGLSETLYAAIRGENITSIFVNNCIYGMTGGQMAPTTLLGQKTSTTPLGRDAVLAGHPLDLPDLVSRIEGAEYVAAESVDSPKNVIKAKKALRKAFKVQMEGRGYSFVSFLSTCPTNWRMDPVQSIKWLRENMMDKFRMGELKSPADMS